MSEAPKETNWKEIANFNGLRIVGHIFLALAIIIIVILWIVSSFNYVPSYKSQTWLIVAASSFVLSWPFYIASSIATRQNILIQQNNRIIELLENKSENEIQEE